jgi:hypothetical protein
MVTTGAGAPCTTTGVHGAEDATDQMVATSHFRADDGTPTRGSANSPNGSR